MLKPSFQAAAEGMSDPTKLTRRAALCGIASIPVMGGAAEASTPIQLPEDPWARAYALAAEMRHVLSEIEGNWDVQISVALVDRSA